jgi:hypothetical protein
MDSVPRDWISDSIFFFFKKLAQSESDRSDSTANVRSGTSVRILLWKGRQSTMQNFDASHANFRMRHRPVVSE